MDGTKNKQGRITSFVELELTINKRKRKEQLLVTELEKQRIILSFPWLHEQNPDINWKEGTLSWREESKPKRLIDIIKINL